MRCGPAARTRTWNKSLEGSCDIPFTTASDLVLRAGLEPAHPKITDFKSVAATNYAIGACCCYMVGPPGLEPGTNGL